MQTFLPLPTVGESLRVLDDRRLGKQRSECLSILQTLHGEIIGWPHHPATKAWRFHTSGLAWYGQQCCDEWKRRGFNDGLHALFEPYVPSFSLPPWVGDERFMVAQRSNLIRKNPAFYRPVFPGTQENLAYLWPAMTSERTYLLAMSHADQKRVSKGERVAA